MTVDLFTNLRGVPLEPRPWPLQPLLDASGLTRGQIARAVGVSGSTVVYAATHGLTDWQADAWANRLGLVHPAVVWGWDEWAAAGTLSVYERRHLTREAA
ncbi:MAG TPA: hypothetical protein VGE43_19535 [Acidimicrobiales bacterium]